MKKSETIIAARGIKNANFLLEIKNPAKSAVAAIGEKLGMSAKYMFKNARQNTIVDSTKILTLFTCFICFFCQK